MSLKYVCHYGEIGLKGRNRKHFIQALLNNIRHALKRELGLKSVQLASVSKRILLTIDHDVPRDDVNRVLDRIFGIAYYSPIETCKPELPLMKEIALRLFRDKQFETFAVRTKRPDKNFPLISEEINRQVGQAILERYGRTVKLKNPDIVCHIEVLRDEVYLYNERREGPGGLPVGVNGEVLVLMSGGIDSPVASWFAMKRGARCHFIHFHSYPFTKKTSQEKVLDLIRTLDHFQYSSRFFSVPFAGTQKEIVLKCPEKLRVILYRRFMMRIAENVAERLGINALVTGESLGQVASQTLENMRAVEEVTALPVLRPLVGMDKVEIIALARRIGTYRTSVQPHDDACTRFMPQNPVIHARVKDVLRAEKELDIRHLVKRDLEAMEEIFIKE